MRHTARTLTILLGLPPLALLILALIPRTSVGNLAPFGMIVTTSFVIVSAIATSRWRLTVQYAIGAAYMCAVLLGSPMLALLGACVTGDRP